MTRGFFQVTSFCVAVASLLLPFGLEALNLRPSWPIWLIPLVTLLALPALFYVFDREETEKYRRRITGHANRKTSLWENQKSPMAVLVGGTYLLLRFLSPLQHWKKQRWKLKLSSDGVGNQRRPDFHAKDSERYFFFVLVLHIAFYLVSLLELSWLGENSYYSILSKSIAVLLILEAFTWISYYLFWRNYAEAHYTLYHPAEYFLMFPLVFFGQVVGIAVLFQVDPTAVLGTMLGDNATTNEANKLLETWGTPLRLMGFFYFAVLLSILTTMHPVTKFKSTTLVSIVGSGDVVRKRMLGAFLRDREGVSFLSPLTKLHVKIFTTDHQAGQDANLTGLVSSVAAPTSEEEELIFPDKIEKELIADQIPVVIATPSDSHFQYISKLNSAGLRFAVEKPLSTLSSEIQLLTKNVDSYKDSIFSLSYYGLEKALPVTYITSGNPHFERFLCDENGKPLKRPDLLNFFEGFGKLKSIDIALIESFGRSPTAATRNWTEERNGLAFETFIHPAIIAHKLLAANGSSIEEFDPDIIYGGSEDSVTPQIETYMETRGEIPQSGDNGRKVSIRLATAKYADLTMRRGMAIYDKGKIYFDFEEKSATLIGTLNDEPTTMHIHVRDEFKGNYFIQTDLMRLFFKTGWTDVRFDDLEDQLVVLNWLVKQPFPIENSFYYGTEMGFERLHENLPPLTDT